MPERIVPEEVSRHLLYSGSVKDVYGIAGRDPYVFHFSDRYSIFDWGEMPDALPGKGEALAVMGDLFFRFLAKPEAWASWQIPEQYPKFWRDSFSSSDFFKQLRRSGLAHHSLGLVDEQGMGVAEGQISRRLAVRSFQRPPAKSELVDGKIVWDYSAYAARPDNALVPLEVVFRFGAPEGSSFLSRAEKIPGYAQSLGFAENPAAGEMFPYPIVEFFTKLEPTDRFLTRAEAMVVGALKQEELDDLVSLTTLLALRMRDIFSPLGLELWDGKFEFAFCPGEGNRRGFLLVDSIGPDELRLIGAAGVHFSKEFLRRVYRGSPWYVTMEKAKKLAKERGEKNWKKICKEELNSFPDKLPKEVFESARLMYPALANGLASAFLGKTVFADTPTVMELCKRLKEVL
ncbi:MAG TPA: phosphoribosylaminoimidazolesuccinocarboxamide synthase [Bdellovibrionota bacterium]|jgi:phosphoribosylaminoimidazole-succinocarboxamide synthase